MTVSEIPLWGWLDILSTLAVLIGVFGESHWMERFLEPRPKNEPKPERTKAQKVKALSEKILIVGVAGELFCLPLGLIETAKLNKTAEEARERSKNADERIAKLELERDQIAKQLEETRLTASIAAQAAREATNLVNDASVVVAKHLDRRLSAGQKYELVKSLDAAPKTPIMFELNSLVPDVEGLANDLGEVFSRTGFAIRPAMRNLHDPLPWIEIVSSGDTNLPAAVILSEKLSSMGLPSRAYPVKPIAMVPEGVILINIGKKSE